MYILLCIYTKIMRIVYVLVNTCITLLIDKKVYERKRLKMKNAFLT